MTALSPYHHDESFSILSIESCSAVLQILIERQVRQALMVTLGTNRRNKNWGEENIV
jgi:hypothetical protein